MSTDDTSGTRVRLTDAEQRDIQETRHKIIKAYERTREKAKEMNLALMSRIRKAHPEGDGKFIKPEGEWLIIFEGQKPTPVILGTNGRALPPSEING